MPVAYQSHSVTEPQREKTRLAFQFRHFYEIEMPGKLIWLSGLKLFYRSVGWEVGWAAAQGAHHHAHGSHAHHAHHHAVPGNETHSADPSFRSMLRLYCKSLK